MTISLTIKMGYPNSRNDFTTSAEGGTITDVLSKVEKSIAKERRLQGIKPEQWNMQNNCHLTFLGGIPSWLYGQTRVEIEEFLNYDKQPRKIVELDRILLMSDKIDSLIDSVHNGIPIDSEIMELMNTKDFLRIIHLTSVDLKEAAELSGQNSIEIREHWRALMFSEPATSYLSVHDAEWMDIALKNMYQGHDDILKDPDRFRADGGACGLWASVFSNVVDGGGHYIIAAGSRFDPNIATGCSHVAVRLGNYVVDGKGVHELADFMSDWAINWDCLHEVYAPEDEGVIGFMREWGHAKRMLDDEKLENALKDKGFGPNLVQEISCASPTPYRF